jgi:hypothetical protein
MAFTFQLDPEMERALSEQAQSQGVSMADYIRQVLERQLAVPRSGQKLDDEAFEAALDAMTVYFDKISSGSVERVQTR